MDFLGVKGTAASVCLAGRDYAYRIGRRVRRLVNAGPGDHPLRAI
jgi:hypothetical protein